MADAAPARESVKASKRGVRMQRTRSKGKGVNLKTRGLVGAQTQAELYAGPGGQELAMQGKTSSGKVIDYVLVYTLPEAGADTDAALIYLAENTTSVLNGKEKESEGKEINEGQQRGREVDGQRKCMRAFLRAELLT